MRQSSLARPLVSRNGELNPPFSAVKLPPFATVSIKSCLSRSASTKKNSLSFQIGPPNWPPKLLRWNARSEFAMLAAIEWSRNKQKASPWHLLVPERVTTFTAPEDVNSVERSSDD